MKMHSIFSKVGVCHPVLFKRVAEHLVGSSNDPNKTSCGFKDFNPQNMANNLWAFAKQAQYGAATLERFDKQTMVPRGTGQLDCYIFLPRTLEKHCYKNCFQKL